MSKGNKGSDSPGDTKYLTGRKVTRYDWESLFSRKRFVLVKGRDYHCQVHGMAMGVRNAATRRKVRVSVITDGETITVQVLGKKG